MKIVIDASFGHAQITPANMRRGGFDGAILYAGCRDTGKNVTKTELHALLDAGFPVGLVIENFATDARGGYAVGLEQGRAIVAAAKDLGYDWQNCVLFGGYDTDSHAGDWPSLLAYEQGFASVVPVPGFYSDSDAIDFLHDHGSAAWIFWQSNSTSFSPQNPTPNAHLLQKYNDPRAIHLPVDINVVERSPLRLMGEEDMPTPADFWNYTLDEPTPTPGQPVYRTTAGRWLTFTNEKADAAVAAAKAATAAASASAAQVKALQDAVAALQAQVAALQPNAALGGTATVTIDLAAKQ